MDHFKTHEEKDLFIEGVLKKMLNLHKSCDGGYFQVSYCKYHQIREEFEKMKDANIFTKCSLEILTNFPVNERTYMLLEWDNVKMNKLIDPSRREEGRVMHQK